MRALIVLATLLIPAALSASNVVEGQPAPDFALRTVAGQTLRLSEYRGQVVLLTFWADFCKRCKDQLHVLDELQARYAADGLQVLAVNIDAGDQPAVEAARRVAIPVLHDADRSVARQYSPGNLPLVVVVDHDGAVRHVHETYRGGDERLYDEELAALLRE